MQSIKDKRLHVAIIMDGNGRWAARRASGASRSTHSALTTGAGRLRK